MTTFVKGRTLKTAAATVQVDAGLAVGTHRFQLLVVNGDGRQSAPAVVDVVVTRPPLGGLLDEILGRLRVRATPRQTPKRKPAGGAER
ncbi:hypothetical protein [Candidatus Accumulibacter sp. ACC003]|uniref:hypothetical protein n=1 Tax=Candidatus Accumulibacter sp. ACC003 TaxID=2823334 RepID=UPI0025C3989E|nr:hypothetical protein [Candidatus Accumulibacter sp. ACC003]